MVGSNSKSRKGQGFQNRTTSDNNLHIYRATICMSMGRIHNNFPMQRLKTQITIHNIPIFKFKFNIKVKTYQ